MSKRGLPTGVSMRHDSHYVEDLARINRTVGKILPINKIQPNPDQPRVEIGDLSELSDSIRQNGVLEPILVKANPQTGIWMIIAGERRWRASNLAGLKEIPCIELDIDDQSIAEIALIENMQRKDLTSINIIQIKFPTTFPYKVFDFASNILTSTIFPMSSGEPLRCTTL